MLAKHPNIAPKKELPDIVAQCEEPINRPTAADCPLCDEWEKAFAKSQYGDLSKLRKHLGGHMEQLALFALPRAEPDEGGSDSDGELDEEDEADEGEELKQELRTVDWDEIIDVFPGYEKSSRRIFVRGLSEDVGLGSFANYFLQFGLINDYSLVEDKYGISRGFGTIEFGEEAAVDACLSQQLEILGKSIEVRRAVPQGHISQADYGNHLEAPQTPWPPKPDLSELWIQHQRRNTKTTISWACIFCPDRRIYLTVPELLDHAQKDHRERLPTEYGELEVFLGNFAAESAQERPRVSSPRGPEGYTEALFGTEVDTLANAIQDKIQSTTPGHLHSRDHLETVGTSETTLTAEQQSNLGREKEEEENESEEHPSFRPPRLSEFRIAQLDPRSKEIHFVNASTGDSQCDTPTQAARAGSMPQAAPQAETETEDAYRTEFRKDDHYNEEQRSSRPLLGEGMDAVSDSPDQLRPDYRASLSSRPSMAREYNDLPANDRVEYRRVPDNGLFSPRQSVAQQLTITVPPSDNKFITTTSSSKSGRTVQVGNSRKARYQPEELRATMATYEDYRYSPDPSASHNNTSQQKTNSTDQKARRRSN